MEALDLLTTFCLSDRDSDKLGPVLCGWSCTATAALKNNLESMKLSAEKDADIDMNRPFHNNHCFAN